MDVYSIHGVKEVSLTDPRHDHGEATNWWSQTLKVKKNNGEELQFLFFLCEKIAERLDKEAEAQQDEERQKEVDRTATIEALGGRR